MIKRISSLLLVMALVASFSGTVFAAEFTPSVKSKPAPEIVMQKGSDGKEYAAIIYDADGKEMIGVPSGALIVTPVSAASQAPLPEIRAMLESAYKQIKSAKQLTALSEELEKVVKEISLDLQIEDLAVRDLFDVTVIGTYAEYLSQEGSCISVRFKLSADAESLIAVLHNMEGTTWETVSNDRITRNKDCTADIVFYELSPVAFVFDVGQLDVDPNGPKSPQTGDPVTDPVLLGIGGAVAVFAAAYIMRGRFAKKS